MRVALLDRPRSRTSGTVTPASRHFSGRSAQKMHAAKGQHIVGVDMSKMPLSDLGSDNVHPNDTGYAYMANIWYAAIKDLLPK